jgi:hypothetical protein
MSYSPFEGGIGGCLCSFCFNVAQSNSECISRHSPFHASYRDHEISQTEAEILQMPLPDLIT